MAICKVAINDMLKILHNEGFPQSTCYLATATRMHCIHLFIFKIYIANCMFSLQERFRFMTSLGVWSSRSEIYCKFNGSFTWLGKSPCPSVGRSLHHCLLWHRDEYFRGRHCVPFIRGCKQCWTQVVRCLHVLQNNSFNCRIHKLLALG